MDEELIREEFDLPEETGEEKEQTLEPNDEPTLSPIEEEASSEGWTTKEEFVKAGKDPENWVSAREYVRYGKLQKASREATERLERQFNEKLDGVNKFHEMQLKATIEQLKNQKKEAIETGDVDAVDRIEGQLDQLKVIEKPVSQKPAAVLLWEAKNTWINEPNNPKTLEANALYKAYGEMNPNGTIDEALKFVDETLAVKYPSTNTRRSLPASTEKGQRQSSKASHQWSDLSKDEMVAYEHFGDMFKTKQAYIDSAILARGKK